MPIVRSSGLPETSALNPVCLTCPVVLDCGATSGPEVPRRFTKGANVTSTAPAPVSRSVRSGRLAVKLLSGPMPFTAMADRTSHGPFRFSDPKVTPSPASAACDISRSRTCSGVMSAQAGAARLTKASERSVRRARVSNIPASPCNRPRDSMTGRGASRQAKPHQKKAAPVGAVPDFASRAARHCMRWPLA